MASISYGILVCNEHRELDRLLSLLLPFVRPIDEVVVLIDQKKATYEVYDVISQYRRYISVRDGEFNGNFAEWRNLLTEICTKDWIFQIDADEVVAPGLIGSLRAYIESNEYVDALAVPRVNTVQGLTQEDILKWGWQVNTEGWVNWPDYQARFFKNDGTFKFEGEVHEHLVGGKIRVTQPMPGLALIHPKTIERQRKQNELYATYNSK